jgi:hypothetical protein
MCWRWEAFYSLIMHAQASIILLIVKYETIAIYIIENDLKAGFVIDESATIG